MKKQKISNLRFSIPHALAAAVFLLILGAVIIIGDSVVKCSFITIGIIVLEAALVKFTMYAAVKPYENKPGHLYTAITLAVSGAVILLLSLFRIGWIIMILSIVPCVLGLLGLRAVIRRKYSAGTRNTLICVTAGLLVAGFASALCSVIFSSNRIMIGIIFICSGILTILLCTLFAAAEKKPVSDGIGKETIEIDAEDISSK